jgi:hypothetical protein
VREWDTFTAGFYAAVEQATAALTAEEQARHAAVGRALDLEAALAQVLV